MSDEYAFSQEQHQPPVQKEEAQEDLVFLNFTKLDEHKDVNNRKIIRMRAMSHFKRPKTCSRKIATIALRPGPSFARSERVLRPRGDPCRDGRDAYLGMLRQDNSAMLLDSSLHTRTMNSPHDLPSTAPGYAPMFLHYFGTLLNPDIQETTPESPKNPMRTTLVPAALSEQIYLETMMYMVSTHLDVLRGTHNSRTTLFHRGESLKLINEHLQQYQPSPNDLLIVAALGLVNYDNVNGQLAESKTHMTGVRTMVMLRGGLRYLGMNGVLAKMILLGDVMGVALGTSESIFQLSELRLENPNRNSLGILPIRKTVDSQNSISLEAYGIPETMICLLNMVREVNMYCSTIEGVQWTEKSATELYNATSQLRQKLCSLAKDNPNQDPLHPKYYQSECCRLATQIYVESMLSPLSFLDPVNDSLVEQLTLALRKANCLGDWKPIPEAFVWICLVGGAAAKGRPMRRWMVAHLGPAMMSLGMQYFEDLIASMLLFARVSRLCSR